MSQRRVSYTVKKHSVNSTILAKEVLQFADDVFTAMGPAWQNEVQRNSIVDVIEQKLEELVEENRIIRYNVICDQRNNKAKHMEKGKFKLSVQYQQRNCVNLTRLEFEIKENSKSSEKVNDKLI